VRFAGYRVPHPLIHDVEIKIQAMDARTTPAKLLESAIEDLSTEADILERQFQVPRCSVMRLGVGW
jgi:DNA-directed RNA polymerase II subunit RPB11